MSSLAVVVALPDDAKIDTWSRRWTVAMHESAHVVACERFGWAWEYAQIHRDGSGVMDDKAPGHLSWDDCSIQSATIALAGVMCTDRLEWFLPTGCDSDRAHAARMIRGLRTSPLSLREVQVEARNLVNQSWPQIKKTAVRLYRAGRIVA